MLPVVVKFVSDPFACLLSCIHAHIVNTVCLLVAEDLSNVLTIIVLLDLYARQKVLYQKYGAKVWLLSQNIKVNTSQPLLLCVTISAIFAFH